MAYFPLQGKTLQVAGHDDGQIFSSRKKKDHVEQKDQTDENTKSVLKQKQKIAS